MQKRTPDFDGALHDDARGTLVRVAPDISGATAGDLTVNAAYQALEGNQVQEARQMAQSALLAAKACGDLRQEAKSLECLAHCDRVMQRARRSSDASRRAARLYEKLGDAAGESAALNLLAHSCVLLGQGDEALEAALLSVHLSQSECPTAAAVFAYNGLGMAYCWSGNHERAASCLELAISLARGCNPPVSSYQPKLNQLFVEALRVCAARYQTGTLPGLQRMNQLIRETRRIERSGERLDFLPGMLPAARVVSAVMKALYCSWEGQLENAVIYAERSIGFLGGTVTWLDAFVRWAVAELAWAQRDFDGAEFAFKEMKTLALKVEHEALASLAHLLLAQVYAAQGKPELAMLEYKALRVLEQRMVAESVASRETVVKWQIGARRSEHNLEQAIAASRQFERWSLEDPLTGIANRRAFEHALSERLPSSGSGRPLTVAMIDVDRFKAVNDTFSHQIGDQVLKALASILLASVRDDDVAARLAGDEFVVLFRDAEASIAEAIIHRIQSAVMAFSWNSLAPGLNISVSIGLGEAVEGDTVESVMHRSDKNMYSVKPGWNMTTF